MQRSISRSSHQSISPPISPLSSTTASLNSGTPAPSRNSKIDQIIHNFYAKVAQTVLPARSTVPSKKTFPHRRTNKWFNLELDDIDNKDDLVSWKRASAQSDMAPMIIEVILDLSDMTHNQMLHLDLQERGHRINLKPRQDRIVLERWKVELSSPLPRTSPDLPIVYKKSIILFRSLYTLVNLLPAYKLYRQLRKRNQQNSLKMVCRITTGRLSSSSTIGLETPLVDDERLMRHDFVPVLTPLGSLSVHVSYRQNCRFRVDDTETLLSSRFIDMDENYFTPTMARFPSQTNSPHNASKAAPSGPISASEPHRRQVISVVQKPEQLSDDDAFSAVRPLVWPSHYENPPLQLDKLSDPAFATVVKGDESSDKPDSTNSPVSAIQPFKSPSPLSSISSFHDGRPIPSQVTAQKTVKTLRQSQSPSPGFAPESGQATSPLPPSIKRYSSSFGYRHERGNTASMSSSTASLFREMMFVQPGSSPKPSAATQAAATSLALPNDDDDISAFMRLLDSRKPLKSTEQKETEQSFNVEPSMYQERLGALSHFQKLRSELDDLTDVLSASTELTRADKVSPTRVLQDPASSPRYNSLYAPIVSSSLSREYTTQHSSPSQFTENAQEHRDTTSGQTSIAAPIQRVLSSTTLSRRESDPVPHSPRRAHENAHPVAPSAPMAATSGSSSQRPQAMKRSLGYRSREFDSLPAIYSRRDRSLSPDTMRSHEDIDEESRSGLHEQRADDDDLVFAMSDMASGHNTSAPCGVCPAGACTCTHRHEEPDAGNPSRGTGPRWY